MTSRIGYSSTDDWRRRAVAARRAGTAFTCGTLLALAGCATESVGLGEAAGTVELPVGLTMLDSAEAECGDSVHVGAGNLAETQLGPTLFVAPGQHATFAVEATPVNWACIDDDSQEFHELACADATRYVRVTRATESEELLLECFG